MPAPRPTRAQWAEARALYEEDGLEAYQIAVEIKVGVRALHRCIKLQKWRSPYDPMPGLDEAAQSAVRNIAAQRARLRRLCRVIDIKLKLMERRVTSQMEQTEDRAVSAADHERDVRSIASLSRQLAQVKEMQADLERVAGGLPVTLSDAELFLEADRFRRELAERLARFIPAPG